MKIATLSFLALLLLAHCVGDTEERLGQPLSMFRDGAYSLVGYALFASLLVIGGLAISSFVRSDQVPQAVVFGGAALLLGVVAATDSLGSFHLFCSLLLLFLLYAFYALELYRAGSPWLWAHLAAPVVLLLLSNFHSFGVWQKGLVVYFVLAVTVHSHLLTPQAPARRAARGSTLPGKKRRVVVLDHGARSWGRRRRSPWETTALSS
jgi:hypothetical protein